MAVLTPLSSSDVSNVLSRYSLGDLEQHWPAPEGIENTNYFLRVSHKGGSREYVLTVLEANEAPEEVLLPVLQAAGNYGLPVTLPVRDRHGRAAERVGSKPALLTPRLSGAHPVQPSIDECAAIGRFLARFHRSTSRLAGRVPPHPRDPDWLDDETAYAAPRLSWTDRALLQDAVAASRALLSRQDVATLPSGVVHGDLFRDNALFSAGTLSGVLDFHHSAHAPFVFDLAVTANDWCIRDARVDQQRLMALLGGYDGIRRINSAELWFLPGYMLFAATTFWLARLHVRLRSAGLPSKNPSEMARLVDAHWRHPPVVDERLLHRRPTPTPA